ncbi:MAG: diacylglycerol kinase family protein [Alphaproteobacteria bacterium]|nr:diacylglycerol kinase family protein [Alphaproteobacteria bacterium]
MQPDKFDFVINRRSGTVLDLGIEQVQHDIRAAFGDKTGDMLLIEGQDIAQTVRTWADQHAGGTRGLIICGGDGTLLTAANQVLGRKDVTIGTLPLGTNCLVARQLGLTGDFKKAAAKYKDIETVDMDVAQVNGKNFLVAMLIDPNSVQLFHAREELRDGDTVAIPRLMQAITGALTGTKTRIRVEDNTDNKPKDHAGRIIMISNNPVTPRPNTLDLGKTGADLFKDVTENIVTKNNLNTGKLALYAIKGNAWNFGLLNPKSILQAAWNGTWTQHKSVTSEVAPELTVEPARKKDAGKDIPIIIDGELEHVQYPLKIKSLPGALRMFRPKP